MNNFLSTIITAIKIILLHPPIWGAWGALSLLLTSCDMDVYPDSAIPEDEAIITVENANQAVVGIYAAFKSPALYSGYLTLLPDIQADLVYAVNGYTNTYGNVWRWDILSTNTEIEATYAALYEVIARSNFLLDNIDKVRAATTDDAALEKTDAYEGEARMARALAYSELIKLFCKPYESDNDARQQQGVAIVRHYNTDDYTPERSSLYDSYQFVLADLNKAESLLKVDDSPGLTLYSNYYFSEYVVDALRARIALYMKDWTTAVQYSTKVIDSGYYSLSSASTQYTSQYTYFQYEWAYDLATEIIWEIGFDTTSYGGALGQVFLNYDWQTYKPDYVPARWVLDSFSAYDIRYSTYFYELQTGYSHALSWPLLIKYYGNQTFFQQYIPMVSMPKPFRLPEQYLIRAEAYAAQGKYALAGTDITTLRKARYSTYGSSTSIDATNAMDIIATERVQELFMEGFRLHDLKRWHKGFTRHPQSQSVTSGSSLNIQADNPLFVWPIPKHEIESPNSNIQQNES